jgi:hypothetical protein
MSPEENAAWEDLARAAKKIRRFQGGMGVTMCNEDVEYEFSVAVRRNAADQMFGSFHFQFSCKDLVDAFANLLQLVEQSGTMIWTRDRFLASMVENLMEEQDANEKYKPAIGRFLRTAKDLIQLHADFDRQREKNID